MDLKHTIVQMLLNSIVLALIVTYGLSYMQGLTLLKALLVFLGTNIFTFSFARVLTGSTMKWMVLAVVGLVPIILILTGYMPGVIP